jgi:hypothetical protein
MIEIALQTDAFADEMSPAIRRTIAQTIALQAANPICVECDASTVVSVTCAPVKKRLSDRLVISI